MRLALLASVVVFGSIAAPAFARTNVSVFVGRGPTTQASWEVVSPQGCTQIITFSVSSARFLTVDTATRTVVRERFEPSLTTIVEQQESAGCSPLTVSTLTELSPAQFQRNGLASARLDVDDIVLSDPDLGTIVLDANLRWTGMGRVTTTPTRERFCDDSGICTVIVGVAQQRAAHLSGDVDATVTTTEGGVSVEDYSPSASENVSASLERFVTVSVTRSPAP
jgi:hypothetical protein